MTTSAALVLMSSVAFSGGRVLDDFTIDVLDAAKSSPQEVAFIASHGHSGTKVIPARAGSTKWALVFGDGNDVEDDFEDAAGGGEGSGGNEGDETGGGNDDVVLDTGRE